jgi:hypothetical protein
LLANRVAKLTIEVPRAARAPDLRVAADGETVLPTSYGVAIAVERRSSSRRSRGAGPLAWREDVQVPSDGAAITVPGAAAAQPVPPEPAQEAGGRRTRGYAVGGVGILGVAAGVGAERGAARGPVGPFGAGARLGRPWIPIDPRHHEHRRHPTQPRLVRHVLGSGRIMHRSWTFSGFALLALPFVGVVGIAGCASADDDGVAGAGQDLVPAAATSLFDQANVCDQLLARHDGVRDADLKAGILRWDCADVRGVTSPDRGQEYCEYQAVANGKAITQASQLKAGDKLSCVFTSVYSDVKDLENSGATAAYRTEIAKQLATTDNLGVAVDPKLAVMNEGFNSRGAADALITTCRDTSKATPLDDKAADVRLAAAFQAFQAGGANAQQIASLAKGASQCTQEQGNITHCDEGLADDATWAKLTALGVKVAAQGDPSYERQRDIAACTRVDAEVPGSPGQTNGVPWRNSDPNICGRVSRATSECSTVWPDGALDNVPGGFDGFLFSGWTGTLPAGCRYMKKDGADYKNVVICDATAQQTQSLKFSQNFAKDAQAFCHDTFAQNIAMVAPLGAVSTTKGKADASSYCGEWVAGK